jgi:hypothetical protein
LGTGEFGAPINLLHCGLHGTGANGANLLGLMILIVDNPVAVLVEIGAKVLRLLAGTVREEGFGSVYLAVPEKLLGLVEALGRTAHLVYVFHPVKPIEHLPSLSVRGKLTEDVPHSLMPIPQAGQHRSQRLGIDPLHHDGIVLEGV